MINRRAGESAKRGGGATEKVAEVRPGRRRGGGENNGVRALDSIPQQEKRSS